jgi:hypothetical protein
MKDKGGAGGPRGEADDHRGAKQPAGSAGNSRLILCCAQWSHGP